VWAYATAGVAAPALFEAVATEALKKIASFNSQALANTVWAYATAGVAAPALFEAVAAEASKKVATFTPQNLANTVWAYATAGVAAPALFEAVAVESSKKIATFEPQALANTVWAYATAGVAAPALFEVLAVSIEATISNFSLDGLSQLHQVSMHLQLEAPQHALTLLLCRHEAELRAAYLRQEPTPSRSQREVSTALARIGWAHDFEHVTAEGISLDMAQPASKVAVEFDGPKHYLAGASSRRVLDGKSKAKERLLRRLGWDVVRVPYFEWDALRSSADREKYLRTKMPEAPEDRS
jgi:very-short-patch-repair endonuclease